MISGLVGITSIDTGPVEEHLETRRRDLPGVRIQNLVCFSENVGRTPKGFIRYSRSMKPVLHLSVFRPRATKLFFVRTNVS